MRQLILGALVFLFTLVVQHFWERYLSEAPQRVVDAVLFVGVATGIVLALSSDPVLDRLRDPQVHRTTSTLIVMTAAAVLVGSGWWIFAVKRHAPRISDSALCQRAAILAVRMRATESKYAERRAQLQQEQDKATARVFQKYPGGINPSRQAPLMELHDEYSSKSSQLRRDMEAEVREMMHSEAAFLNDELLSRIPPRDHPKRSLGWFFQAGMLSGVNPLGEVAARLESLARLLCERR